MFLWGLVVLCSPLTAEDDPSHAGVTAPVSAELTNPLEKASSLTENNSSKLTVYNVLGQQV